MAAASKEASLKLDFVVVGGGESSFPITMQIFGWSSRGIHMGVKSSMSDIDPVVRVLRC